MEWRFQTENTDEILTEKKLLTKNSTNFVIKISQKGKTSDKSLPHPTPYYILS